MADGLLVGGQIWPVPGAMVLGPSELEWLTIQGRDGRLRTPADPLPQMITNHTTKGIWPQKIIPGAPLVSVADMLEVLRAVADYWRKSQRGSQESGAAALIVYGNIIAQLVDVIAWITYRAGQNEVNARSIGLEMVQGPKGEVYGATLETTAVVNVVLADACGIPFQTHGVVYPPNDKPTAEVPIIRRLRYGGDDVVGMLGHRDNAWREPQFIKDPAVRARFPDGYGDRGRGDPGDEVYERFKRHGALSFDFHQRQDLAFWMRVQDAMNTRYGTKLPVDGICGQKTVTAMRKHGIWNGGVFPEFPVP